MKKIISSVLSIIFAMSVIQVCTLNANAENIVSETIEAYASASKRGNTITNPSPYLTIGNFWGNSIAYGFDLTSFKGASKFITSAKVYIYPYNPSNISDSWKGYRDNDSKLPVLLASEAQYDEEWQKVFGKSYANVSYFPLKTINKTDLETVDTAEANIFTGVTANVKQAIDSTGYYTFIVDHNDGLETKFQPAGKKYAAKLELTYDKDEVYLMQAENSYNDIKNYIAFEPIANFNDTQLEALIGEITVIKGYLAEVSECERKTSIEAGLKKIEENIDKKAKLNDFIDVSSDASIASDRDYYFEFYSQTQKDIKIDGNNLGVDVSGNIVVKLSGKKVYIFTETAVYEKVISEVPSNVGKVMLSDYTAPSKIQNSSLEMGMDNIDALLKMCKISTNEKANADDCLNFCESYEKFSEEYNYFSTTALIRTAINNVFFSLNDDYNKFKELSRIYSYILIAEESLEENDLNIAISEASECTDEVLLKRLEDLKKTVRNTIPYVKTIKMTGEFEVDGTICAVPVICYPNNSVGETTFEWRTGGNVLSNTASLYLDKDYENQEIYCYVTPSNSFGEKGNTVRSVVVVIGDKGSEDNKTGFVLRFSDVPINGVSSFLDTKDHWARDIIEYLAENGVVNGVEDNYFMPNENVTRSQFLKMVMSVINITPIVYEEEFIDVKKEDWFADYVSTAYYNEIINGTDGRFRPNDSITRQEMAAIIVHAAEIVKSIDGYGETLYDDRTDISSWAVVDVDKAAYKKYMTGTPENLFMPNENATRAEAATVIYNFLQNE